MRKITIFNSLTRRKELFIPLQSGKIGLYVCGMTVYDFCHLGHARVMVVFDTVVRYLRYCGYEVRYVRNITDIDDKIIARAAQLNESIQQLTTRVIAAMHDDAQNLYCLAPDVEPRATESIAAIITLISKLIANGNAYVGKNGDVYFEIATFANYGKLANQNLQELRAGARVQINDDKRDALDFVLWKAAKENEPHWQSPWGNGRPGWHIECSAMATANLGAKFDIHGGGMDLKFPHHECEIAQSEAACGHRHVNYWMHNGFVQIDNEKMAKSLGNFFTLRDLLQQFDGEVIRYFMLSAHYRAPLNYYANSLSEAKKALGRLYGALLQKNCNGKLLPQYLQQFNDAMCDDFNTPKALAVLFELARQLNKATPEQQTDIATTLHTLAAQLGLLTRDPQHFLQNEHCAAQQITTAQIEKLLDERLEAKKMRDFARADAIRAQLKNAGIAIKDEANGSSWYRD